MSHLRPLYMLALAASLVIPLSAATTIYQTHLREVDAKRQAIARQEDACDNRQAIVEAFDFYTDALIGASQRPDRTPEDQARVDASVVKFRADIAERLSPLEEGC